MSKESAEHRSGLTFKVSAVEKTLSGKILEKDLHYKLSKRHSVPFTAVVEYMIAEILELSGNASRADHKVRIKIEHMVKAINNDEELNKVFNTDTTVVPDDIPKFSTWTYKVLKQVHPDTGINADTSRFLDKLIFDLMELIAVGFPQERKNIDINAIITGFLPGELAKHATNEATKAITKYNASYAGPK